MVADIMLAFVAATEAADDAEGLLAEAELEAEPLKMAIRFESQLLPLLELASADCEPGGVPLAFNPVALDPVALEPPASALSDSWWW